MDRGRKTRLTDEEKKSLKEQKKQMIKEQREELKRSIADAISKKTGVAHELEYRFAKERRWRADIAFPAVRVAIEIDGGTWVYGRHNNAASAEAEMEKGNGYAYRFWHVFHTPWRWLEKAESRQEFCIRVSDTVEALNNGRGF